MDTFWCNVQLCIFPVTKGDMQVSYVHVMVIMKLISSVSAKVQADGLTLLTHLWRVRVT